MTTYTSGRGGYAPETVTYYRGTATIYSPVTQEQEDARGNYCTCGSADAHMYRRADDCPSMAGGSYNDHVFCQHRHPTPELAETCGRRLGQREARRRTRETQN